MKILHLSESDLGDGAARGAYWLHKALLAEGVNSRMLVQVKLSQDDTVISANGLRGLPARLVGALRAKIDQSPLHLYPKREPVGWFCGWLPSRVPSIIRRLKPDLVHLQWYSILLAIQQLKTLRAPLVCTMRGMHVFTGGCGFAGTCTRFKSTCGDCPQLHSRREEDLSRWTYRRKLRHWNGLPLHIVGVSTWLSEQAAASTILKSFPISTIQNGVNIDTFRPQDRARAREKWGLPQDKVILLLGAFGGAEDPRKGGAFVPEVMRRLRELPDAPANIEIVLFGGSSGASMRLPYPMHQYGFIRNDHDLATLYSAADMLVAPYVQDACPKMPIESIACGTPVVAFNNTGVTDLVDHQKTGYLAKDLDSEDMAQGIVWTLKNSSALDLHAAARKMAKARFDARQVARRYLDLYQQVCH